MRELSTVLDRFFSSIDKLYIQLDATFESKSKRNTLWILTCLVCFGIVLMLNVLTPMIADDFSYIFVFGENHHVSSFSDITQSQIAHYKLWGGRSVVHFIAQVLLLLPQYVADILNTLVYLLFTFLIYLHIKGQDKKRSLSLFIIINLAIWFAFPMYGETILWITGSANYLWGTTIILLFLLPYRLYNGKQISASHTILLAVPMLIFGIITGWTNENTVAGMTISILLFFTYYRSQKWKIPTIYIIGLLGIIIGYIIMIKAPGNFKRGGDGITFDLLIILKRIFIYTQTLFIEYATLIALYAAAIILHNRFTTKKDKSSLSISFIYLLGAIAAIYVMVLSPQFPLRAWFGAATFMFIALGVVIYRLNFNELFIRKIRDALIIVACITFSFSLIEATKDIYRIYLMDKERIKLVEEAHKKGLDKCYFERYIPHTKYVHEENSSIRYILSIYNELEIEFRKE